MALMVSPSLSRIIWFCCSPCSISASAVPWRRTRVPVPHTSASISLRGHAFRFQVVLPMYGSHGEPVFKPDHLVLLFTLFNQRVGGSLAPNSRSGAPYFGEYQPERSRVSISGRVTDVWLSW